MIKLYNEAWISLVIGKWNWIWLSHEIEDWDFEERKWWWKSFEFRNIVDFYLRIQIWRQVIILSIKDWLVLKKNKRVGLKLMLGITSKI